MKTQVRVDTDRYAYAVPGEPFQLCNSFFVDEKAREAVMLIRFPKSGRRSTITVEFVNQDDLDAAVVRIEGLERCTLCDREWKAMTVAPVGAAKTPHGVG